MENKEYIEREALISAYDKAHKGPPGGARKLMVDAPAAEVIEVNKVAEMLHVMFGDGCACDYFGNDTWLPFVCEYGYTECPDAPEENGCWKQFVKHFLAKMDGERKKEYGVPFADEVDDAVEVVL